MRVTCYMSHVIFFLHVTSCRATWYDMGSNFIAWKRKARHGEYRT